VTTTRPSSSINWHESVPLIAARPPPIALLDGNHDRERSTRRVGGPVLQNMIRIDRDDEELVDVAEVRDVLAGRIDGNAPPTRRVKLVRVSAEQTQSAAETGPQPFNPLDLINVSERGCGGGYLHAP